jgi:hypothetical protein
MAGAEASATDHHGSHNELLWLPDSTSSARKSLDAIIVPTVRRPSFLDDAADLAAVLGCTLVTLHSGKFTSAEKARRELPAKADLLAIDVPREARLRLPRWRTSRLLEGTAFARRSDLSTKRNLGLLLSRMLGWSRVLYLDDDISGLRPDDIKQASGMLDVHNAVGLKVGGFPDHSVVCHAYREAGGNQQAFIGGGAMAVQARRSTSFFPDIYNDDWFFLLDGKRGLQSVAATGEVLQDPYDPFRTPERARGEELGDVLAEGLYWLLDQGRSVADADREHWEAFLIKREKFILRVLTMVEESNLEVTDIKRMSAALHGSLDSLSLISPALCVLYLRRWAEDREQWQEHLGKVPEAMSRRQALNWLTADGTPWPVGRRPGMTGPPVMEEVGPSVMEEVGPPVAEEEPVPGSEATGAGLARLLPVAALVSMLMAVSAVSVIQGQRLSLLWSAASRDRGWIGRLRWRTRR